MSNATTAMNRKSGASAPQTVPRGILSGKKVAVLLFSHYPSDPRPRRAAEALAQEGANVEVFCLQQDGEPKQEVFNGVKIRRIPIKRRRGGKFAYVFQYASFILATFCFMAFRSLTRRYSLVHVHNMPDILVFSALIPKLLGSKIILDLHDPMPELMMTIFGLKSESRAVRILKTLEKLSIGFSNAVLTVNLHCKKIFGARSGPAEKIQVVMNAPDEGIFEYRAASPSAPGTSDSGKPFIIMYHGSLVERHGLDLAVQAMESLKVAIPRAELRVYGNDTPYLRKVMETVREHGLEDRVKFLGEKNLNQVAQAIDECDVGIIPNRRSIFTELNTPTRIFEYLSRAKPVIAPSAPGIQDYFNADALVFFKLGDAADLTEKIQYVFSNRQEVNEIVHRGQDVLRAHNWSQERARLLAVAGGLLGNAKQSASTARAASSAKTAQLAEL
jgi:glycosyltransferase involved in cell wall biosynthesis